MSIVFRSFRELKESGKLSLTIESMPSLSENEQLEVGIICYLPSMKSFPAKFGNIVKIKEGDDLQAQLYALADSLVDTLKVIAQTGKDKDGITYKLSEKIKEIILCQSTQKSR